MIVCNEGRIIRRLLDSIQNIVAEYVIVDTGSTDDTVEQIKKHPLPGVVLHHPFVNFGVSRTYALEQARTHSKCQYLLLMDADMEMQIHQFPSSLTADAYYITQKTSGATYQNIRLLKKTLEASCVGSTHECYQLPPGAVVDIIPFHAVAILEHPDGGCKSEKFERDYRLLQEDRRQQPANPRTTFYLAQTCFDLGKYEEAIEYYEKRISQGGWEQEIHYSTFRIGLAYLALKNAELAETWMQRAHIYGNRAEPFYYFCKALREEGDHCLAYYYLLQATLVPKPLPQDCLFIEDKVYDYLLDFERCVLWYYVHPSPCLRPIGMDLSLHLLDKPGLPEDLRQCILSNTVYYVTPLKVDCSKTRHLFGQEVFGNDEHGTWRYASVGFLGNDDDDDGGGGNIYTRLVNYYYLDDGTTFPDDIIRTRLLVRSRFIDDICNQTTWHQPSASVKGLEDTRIVPHNGTLYTLSASREYSRDPESISQVVGKIDVDQGSHTILAVIASPLQNLWEKNWVVAGDFDHVIYRWYPDIWVGRIDIAAESYIKSHTITSPPSFLGMRGSTNGVLFQNLWWFVTHTAIYDRGPLRKYTHRIVAINKELTEIKHASKPFVFEPHADIEYCLGFRILSDGNGQNTAVFAYSVRDRLPRTLEISLQVLIQSLA